MPPKKVKNEETKTAVVAPVATPAPVAEKVAKTEKKSSTKSASTKSASTKTPSSTASTKTPKTPKVPREKPTKEGICSEFDALTALVDREVEELRSNSKKNGTGNVKFLQQLKKKAADFRRRLSRVLRLRNKSSNPNAGFTRPVEVSPDMRKFIDHADPTRKGKSVSRIDVTKTINAFIKSQNLQNPNDRKVILWEKNPSLKALFTNVGPSDVVTYFTMHKYLKNHFSPSAASSSSTPAPVKTK